MSLRLFSAVSKDFQISSDSARKLRVQGAGCRVQGAGCRVKGAGCRVNNTIELSVAIREQCICGSGSRSKQYLEILSASFLFLDSSS